MDQCLCNTGQNRVSQNVLKIFFINTVVFPSVALGKVMKLSNLFAIPIIFRPPTPTVISDRRILAEFTKKVNAAKDRTVGFVAVGVSNNFRIST